MVSLTAFNLGNWYFGFHYFKCSSEMEFIIDVDADKSQDALANVQEKNELLFKLIAYLNIAVILVYGTLLMV